MHSYLLMSAVRCVSCRTALYFIALFCAAVLHCTALYSRVLYYSTTLYCAVRFSLLSCTAPHYTHTPIIHHLSSIINHLSSIIHHLSPIPYIKRSTLKECTQTHRNTYLSMNPLPATSASNFSDWSLSMSNL